MAAIAPETIAHIGNFPVTNTFITTLFVDAVLISLVVAVTRSVKKVPGFLQNAFEMLIEYFTNITQQVAGSKRLKYIFPWVVSFFVFIVVSNYLGLLPGVGSIGFYEEVHGERELVPLLRPGTSDFNTTFALAVVSFFVTQIFAIRYLGGKGYFKHFFRTDPWYLILIFVFIGFLEIISELVKIASLSFRLFGNIFAGEVVLSTVSSMFAFLAPVPFLMLESIVAIVQGLVFAMLTMAFMTAMTESHEGH